LGLAETFLLGEKLGTTSGGRDFLTLGSGTSLSFLDFLQGGTLGHLVGILGPRSNGGSRSINGSLGLGARASSEGIGHVLAITLGRRCRQRRGGGRRRERLRHGTVHLASPNRLRGPFILFLLLLTLGRGSLLNLLG
jgi:hypothetical protein